MPTDNLLVKTGNGIKILNIFTFSQTDCGAYNFSLIFCRDIKSFLTLNLRNSPAVPVRDHCGIFLFFLPLPPDNHDLSAPAFITGADVLGYTAGTNASISRKAPASGSPRQSCYPARKRPCSVCRYPLRGNPVFFAFGASIWATPPSIVAAQWLQHRGGRKTCRRHSELYP